ncbi:hypothetical protein GEMRC1_009591 [Eukaryota sp. GEM-RC1]
MSIVSTDINSLPCLSTAQSLDTFPDASFCPINVILSLSKRQGTTLKVKIVNLFFLSVPTTSELSSLLQNFILIAAAAENALVHPESIFEVNYPNSQRKWCTPDEFPEDYVFSCHEKWAKNPGKKAYAVMGRVQASNITALDLAALLKKETSDQARSITVDDLMAQNPEWYALEVKSWEKWAKMYAEDPAVSAIGPPASLINLFRASDGSMDEELIYEEADLIAQQIGQDLFQLKENLIAIIDSKIMELNHVMSARMKVARKRVASKALVLNNAAKQMRNIENAADIEHRADPL